MKVRCEELQEAPLFFGITPPNLEAMLDCIGAYPRAYEKGEYISFSHDHQKCIGILLQGTVHMLNEDIWGTKTILAFLKHSAVIGETFACSKTEVPTVTFVCATPVEILFLPFHKVLRTCNLTCVFHHRLIENMVALIADKNTQLMEKLEVSSKKSLRDKILSYLSLQAHKQESAYLTLPIGRMELAEYLCADRTALSRELKRMKENGIIDYDKNIFRIL